MTSSPPPHPKRLFRDPSYIDTYYNESRSESIHRTLQEILHHLRDELPYPPVERLPPVSDNPDRANVIFEYTPLIPRYSPTEKCIGMLGKDRIETINLVQRAFTVLSDIAPERLQFHVRVYDTHPKRAEWISISSEAWPSLLERDGLRIRVTLEMTPEEKAIREQEDARSGKILLGVIGVPVVIGLICTVLVQAQVRTK